MAVWTTAYINDLPDSAFLYIEPGGKKDEQGKTVPRSLRHFPIRDAEGRIDLAHLRNALARIPQSSLPISVKRRCLAEARRILARIRERGGVGRSQETDRRRMSSGLRESATVIGGDAEAGVLRNCRLIAAGLNKTGTRYYTPEFLRREVARMEGALCFLDHPTTLEAAARPERSLERLAGRVENVRYSEGAVYGDIVLMPEGVEPADRVRKLLSDPVIRRTAGLSIYWPWGVESRYEVRDGRTVEVPLALQGPPDARACFDFVTIPTAGGAVSAEPA